MPQDNYLYNNGYEGLREQHSRGAIRDIKLGSKKLLTLTSCILNLL